MFTYGTKILEIAVLFALMGSSPKQQTVAKSNVAQISGLQLDNALSNLTTQIASSMAEGGEKKVAVTEFSDLEGQSTGFGKYLAEELITRLFRTGKFEVIERRLLDKVVSEQKLSLTGFIDPSSAKELGKILGVDAIVAGTIADLGTSLKINARIISTQTGSIFAVAATEITKDEIVKKLMGQVAEVQRKKEKVSIPGRVFFEEDFVKYEEGDAVPSWGEGLIIKKGEGGRKFLTSLIPGTHLAGQDVTFPENFEFEYIWSTFGDPQSGETAPYVRVPLELIDEHGKVFRIECGSWGAKLPGLPVIDFSESSINRFKLVKKGTTFKIYNNEEFLLSGTYKGYSRFVSFRITIPVKSNGIGQYFADFKGTDLGEEVGE